MAVNDCNKRTSLVNDNFNYKSKIFMAQALRDTRFKYYLHFFPKNCVLSMKDKKNLFIIS